MTPLLLLLIMGSAWLHVPAEQTSSLHPIPPDLLITLERTGVRRRLSDVFVKGSGQRLPQRTIHLEQGLMK